MAYLNTQEREELAHKLSTMNFNQAKGYIWRLDKRARLRYYRSNQNVNEWETRFELPGLGTNVSLVESRSSTPKGIFTRLQYDLARVEVEPVPENRT